MRRSLLPILFAFACAPAHAATLQVAPPVRVAAGGADPAVVLLPGGGGAVAWKAPDGIYAARRAPDGNFGEPQRLGEGAILELDLAAAPDGRLALTWITGTLGQNDEQRQVRLAVAAPGEPFADAVDVPAGNQGHLMQPHVAVAGDGTTAVGFQRSRVSSGRPVLVLRAPDGTFGEPQEIDVMVINGPSLKADGNGGIVAMWSGRPPGGPGALIQVADRAPGAMAFGAPGAVSPATSNADNNSSPPSLAVNGRGDALVAWTPLPITDGIAFGSTSWTSYRPAGGSWNAPQEIVASGSRPRVALNAQGDSVVTSEIAGIGAAFRPAGGAFEPDWPRQLKYGGSMDIFVALADSGDAVAVNAATPPAPAPGVAAVVRPRGGCFGDDVDLSPRGVVIGAPSLALRGDGTGAVAWASGEAVHVTDLRVLPGGRTECPPGTPARPKAQPATPLPRTKLRVSKTPSKVSRRRLWREGLRFRVRAKRGSAIGAAVMPEGMSLARLATVHGKVGRRGVGTLRVRMKRNVAAALPRGAKLELWIHATAPKHEVGGKIRRFTLR